MAEQHWAMIWHQAVSRSFLDGKAFGWNKTVVFSFFAPAAGERLRLRFSNRYGSSPYAFGAVRVLTGGQGIAVTVNGREQFSVPVGGCVSDPVSLPVRRGEEIQLRLYYTDAVLDSNMIEEEATLLPGDRTANADRPALRRPLLAKLLGAYNVIPSLTGVELLTADPAKAIVAFGDSITAMSHWTKPLAQRLAQAYPGEYSLLNSGITGNCLLYEPGGIFGPVYGAKGTARFACDVLEIPGLDTVIFGLGVNDVAYLSDETAGQINREAFVGAVTAIVDTLHAHGVRVVTQTITPRLGVARTMGKYDARMEALRLELNEWIRGAGLFEYLFDAEAVVREQRPDGLYYREGLHQGDHLHPNARGGQLLADAFDLAKLTGKRG